MSQRLTRTLLLVFFAAIASCNATDENAQQELSAPSQQTEEVDSLLQITGLLQSSGLHNNALQTTVDGAVDFQLLSREAYFLTGHDSLAGFWGKCLTLRGKYIAAPDSLPLYGRKIFQVQKIFPQPFAYCQFSDTTVGAADFSAQDMESLRGKIIRHRRPAPDIAYDYALLPDQPVYDTFNQIDPEKAVDTLPLAVHDFLNLQRLEVALQEGQPLELQGWRQRGYAEQLHFYLRQMQPNQ